jgi:hypothetical protein
MAKRKQTAERSRRHYDPDDGKTVIFEVFPRSKKTIYHLRGGQAAGFKPIVLDGYQALPTGLFLNRRGYGFGRKGVFLLAALRQNLSGSKPLQLVISRQGKKSIKSGAQVTVTLPYDDLRSLLIRFGRINEDSNNELRDLALSFLSARFPTKIKIGSRNFDAYQAGEIAALLRRQKVTEKLNEEDLEALNGFFPKIFEASLKGKKGAVKAHRDALIRNSKSVTDRIVLDDVIEEFDAKLKKKTSEEDWQNFLRDKVFRFLANYITSIDKQNVSIDISYPDFVLVDVYGFIDVFEIKRNDTELLAFDDSHDNYYWKPEVARAISQIENYIDAVIRSTAEYTKSVKRKKGVDIKVIRPRGYIIAGSSQQFKTEKEVEDFRKLSVSLRNISFVLYDELFQRLKNLRAKL